MQGERDTNGQSVSKCVISLCKLILLHFKSVLNPLKYCVIFIHLNSWHIKTQCQAHRDELDIVLTFHDTMV